MARVSWIPYLLVANFLKFNQRGAFLSFPLKISERVCTQATYSQVNEGYFIQQTPMACAIMCHLVPHLSTWIMSGFYPSSTCLKTEDPKKYNKQQNIIGHRTTVRIGEILAHPSLSFTTHSWFSNWEWCGAKLEQLFSNSWKAWHHKTDVSGSSIKPLAQAITPPVCDLGVCWCKHEFPPWTGKGFRLVSE